MKTGGRIHSLIFALLLAAPALAAADQYEPKYIVLSETECIQVALEVAISTHELQAKNKVAREGELSANAARVAAEIVRLNPGLAEADPGQVMAFLTEACFGAQGQTEIPEMVRN